MHFCGPDQLHGFEERLTTDIYPADYGWTPDWERPDDAAELVSQHVVGDRCRPAACGPIRSTSTKRSSSPPSVRSTTMCAGRDDRPFLMVASLTHPHDPIRHSKARLLGPLRRTAGDRRSGHRTRAMCPLDPHSARLRHVCDMDAAEHHVRAGPGRHDGPTTGRSRSATPSSGGCSAALEARPAWTTPIVIFLERPRRDAGRARSLVQDELLRRRGPRAARSSRRPASSPQGRVSAPVSLVDRATDPYRIGGRRCLTPSPVRSTGEASCRTSTRHGRSRRGPGRVPGRGCGRACS